MAITYPTTLDSFTNPTSTNFLDSPSHAQQHSDINDAVEALEAKVAIGNTVLGTYTAYTPTWTNLTVGNGTVVASYARVNNFVHYVGYIVFGSTTAITGSVNIGLPINASSKFSGANGVPVGDLTLYDVSANFFSGIGASIGLNNAIRLRSFTVSGTSIIQSNLSSTAPFTWTTGDYIQFNFIYEAA